MADDEKPPMETENSDDDGSIASDISDNDPYKRRSTHTPVMTADGGVREPINPCWTNCTEKMHHCMTAVVVMFATHAARNPIAYIVCISILAFGLIVAGYFTNFQLELDFEKVFTPLNSRPAEHYDWINSDVGFPNRVRNIALLFHRDGEDVLTVEAMERVFRGVEIVRTTQGFDDLCSKGTYKGFDTGENTCRVMSATGYWDNHNVTVFQAETETDAEVKRRASSFTFATGAPVYHDAILGNWIKDDTNNLTSAQSYLVTIDIPDIDAADEFEERMLETLDQQRRAWFKEDGETGNNVLIMDVLTIYAYELEYFRAIQGDLYLIPLVAFIMCAFVAVTMAKCGNAGNDKLKSRAILGLCAVYTIGMSYIAGNGLMFLCGVPFTTITQILPFVVVGIGLDDTFIITGEYFRTDPRIDTIERIRMTMNEVSHSICLTTITTTLAFLLGLSSSLPGVRWLCIYAFTTILIDFIFQITLFMAFIVMDERRIQAHRRDILCCLKTADHPDIKAKKKAAKLAAASKNNETNGEHHHHARRGTVQFKDMNVMTESVVKEKRQSEAIPAKRMSRTSIARRLSIFDAKSIPQRIMCAYADFLMKPIVKGIVLLAFGGLFGACLWSSTQLKQEFNLGDYVPADSYLKDVLYTFENYASVVRPMAAYFREIDQGDAAIQEQMVNYINDLESLKQLRPPNIDLAGADLGELGEVDEIKPFCWVRDFSTLLENYADQAEDDPQIAALLGLPFEDQLNFALETQPIVRELYGQDIIRDEETNKIIASRCWLYLTDLDLNSIDAQIEMLHDQRGVGENQTLNQASPDAWPMFFFDQLLFYWEAYDVAIQELIFTIASGVVSLAVIAFIMIPHWTAVLVVLPMITMIYINYLGMLQFFGMYVNGIFYICIVVAIGLLVDFLMHVLLRYYETSPTKTRDERVRETLETMGASILLGGLTTFLGVVPLCFSTTKIFFTVFKAFFAMVLLGVTHGLILLPVILSLFGPKTGLGVYEDGVTTFESDVTGPAMDKDAMMAELRQIEADAIKRESDAGPIVEPTAAEPESSDEPDEMPPKRQTLTQIEC